MRKSQKSLIGEMTRRKRPIGKPGCKQDILKWILKKWGGRV
jgi:hypothetical protein